jgi:hypothetical protein
MVPFPILKLLAPFFEGTLTHDRFIKILSNELKNLKELQISSLEVNQFKYLSICNSLIKSLKVKNGKEAMDLICNSQRVADDLSRELKYSDDFSLNIVIREWNDSLSYEMEFRGFVCKNNLTAISQYDSYLYSKKLNDEKDEIENKITTFFNENLKEKLKHLDSYIIDYGILENGKIVIIELNPFNNNIVQNLISLALE